MTLTFAVYRSLLRLSQQPRNAWLLSCLPNVSSHHRPFSVVTPWDVSPTRSLPANIPRPPYLNPGYFLKQLLMRKNKSPEIKNTAQIEGMRSACTLASQILKMAGQMAQVGTTTEEIDQFVMAKCVEHSAYPSPLLYKSFPKAVCTSVNNVACHGIPDARPLENGDIINIDITVYLNGFHGDTSATFFVGEVDAEGQLLVQVARECRDAGVEVCGPGVPFKDVGAAIVDVAETCGFRVVPDFCGHGIGEYFHGPPDILHYKNDYPGVMKEGMTFTIGKSSNRDYTIAWVGNSLAGNFDPSEVI